MRTISVGATARHLVSSLSFQGARVPSTHPALPHVTVLGRLLLFFSCCVPQPSREQKWHR
ncbi:hypothetical protein HanIR_Chr05g0217461 [Helianthus annuus]|nr:hypothetical protein HanIR_Chr05g0217461 [Helianthus annuus]